MTVISENEYALVAEIIKFIVDNQGVSWDSSSIGIKVTRDLNQKLKCAVSRVLERRSMEIVGLYEYEFPDDPIEEERFITSINRIEVMHRLENFDPREFLWLCVLLGQYTAFALDSGVESAPRKVISVIFKHIKYYRDKGQFLETSWNDLTLSPN